MDEIIYIDRITKEEKKEKVYGYFFLNLLYGKGAFRRLVASLILPCVARLPFFSKIYGFFQKSRISRLKILPFINAFQVDTSEFLDPVKSFTCFNDFFIRRLKPSARPMVTAEDTAILPADGRYLVFQDISQVDGFLIKGKKFSLEALLADRALAEQYQDASMVIARLCPTDYHRFHFPCQCVPGVAHRINGPLFSVNPIALRRNIHFLTENKRVLTALETTQFGTVLYLEIGATYVGTIHQTYTAGYPAAKGDEKGYFSFGGSCLILLFSSGRIILDKDLVEASLCKKETLGRLGQSLGKATADRAF